MNKTPAVRIIQPICWKSKYRGIKLNFVPVQFVSYQLHLSLFYRLTLVSECKLIFCTPVNPSFYIDKGKKGESIWKAGHKYDINTDSVLRREESQ